MQNFPGKIGFPGDPSLDVTAVMTVSAMRLEITTGDTSIGDWPIDQLTLELGVRGYVVTLDGEEMILAPHDRFGFQYAVEEAREATHQKVSRRRARKTARASKSVAKNSTPTKGASTSAPGPLRQEGTVLPTKNRTRRKKAAGQNRSKKPKSPKKPAKSDTVPPKTGPPKTAPHVPGLEDPDKDALWATHRTEERTSFRDRLNTEHGVRKLVLAGSGVFLVLAFFAPAVVSFMFLIPGVAAVVLAGLSLLDPSYTRLLPPSLSEIRLMIIGLGFFGASLLVASIF